MEKNAVFMMTFFCRYACKTQNKHELQIKTVKKKNSQKDLGSHALHFFKKYIVYPP